MPTLIRDRRVLTEAGSPIVLFGVLDRETNEIVETFDNRVDARELAADLEGADEGSFISIRLPVEYD